MKKKQLDRDIIVLLFTTMIMVASWVGFEVYRAYVKSSTPTDVEKFLNPLDPVLDQVYLDKIETRFK